MRPDDERSSEQNMLAYFFIYFRSVEVSYGALASI